ncbi:MAG: ThiF family adenylyltransferase [Planctomycetaceae bacterium]|nr:ThiF family adenylyltransferase [Planctomycetaceae bacterium]
MTDRFVRQADLVPRERLHDLTATVLGVGAIGRQVALQLASVGLPRAQLIDFDVVDETNITTQGYGQHDLLQPKVEACRITMANIDPDVEVLTIPDRYRPTHAVGEATVLAQTFVHRPSDAVLRSYSPCESSKQSGRNLNRQPGNADFWARRFLGWAQEQHSLLSGS